MIKGPVSDYQLLLISKADQYTINQESMQNLFPPLAKFTYLHSNRTDIRY